MNSIFLKKQSTLLIQFRKHLKLKLFRESLWYQSILFELVVFVNEERLLFVFIHALVQVFIGSSPVTAVRYKKLERYLFHSVFLCIPWHMRTRSCSSRNVQHTFHCSDKASSCMETKKGKKMISSCRAVLPSRSVDSVLKVDYFP